MFPLPPPSRAPTPVEDDGGASPEGYFTPQAARAYLGPLDSPTRYMAPFVSNPLQVPTSSAQHLSVPTAHNSGTSRSASYNSTGLSASNLSTGFSAANTPAVGFMASITPATEFSASRTSSATGFQSGQGYRGMSGYSSGLMTPQPEDLTQMSLECPGLMAYDADPPVSGGFYTRASASGRAVSGVAADINIGGATAIIGRQYGQQAAAAVEALLKGMTHLDVGQTRAQGNYNSRGNGVGTYHFSVRGAVDATEPKAYEESWMTRVDRQYNTYCKVNPGSVVTLDEFRMASSRGGEAAPNRAFRLENLLLMGGNESAKDIEETAANGDEEYRPAMALGHRRVFSDVFSVERPFDPATSEALLERLLDVVENADKYPSFASAPTTSYHAANGATVAMMDSQALVVARPAENRSSSLNAAAPSFNPQSARPSHYQALTRPSHLQPSARPSRQGTPSNALVINRDFYYGHGGTVTPPWGNGKRFKKATAIQMDLHRRGFTVSNPSSKLRRTLRREEVFGKPDRSDMGQGTLAQVSMVQGGMGQVIMGQSSMGQSMNQGMGQSTAMVLANQNRGTMRQGGRGQGGMGWGGMGRGGMGRGGMSQGQRGFGEGGDELQNSDRQDYTHVFLRR